MSLFDPKHLKLLVPTAMAVVNELRAWQARQKERAGDQPPSAASAEQMPTLREQLDRMSDAQLEQAEFVERCAEQIEKLSAATEALAGRVRVLTIALAVTGVVATAGLVAALIAINS